MEKLHLVHPPPSNNRYTPIRHLGTGGNGSVHLYRDAKKGTLVAVKTIRHEDSISPPNEAHILQPLGPHTNIVQYHTTLPHPSHEDRINLVFEFCPLGDLSAYIQATKTPIPESFAWHVFAHLTHGLHYLHTHGILHGDLKPANILLCPADASSSYPVLKLADFGAATLNPPHNVPRGHMATRGYQPPESEFRNGTQCDVWALGCVVYQLITRRLPLDVFAQPDVEPEVWFELSGKRVPHGTQCVGLYKRWCWYMAFHPPAVRRIDGMGNGGMGGDRYSKLLNLMVLRTLDTNYISRISTRDLQRYIAVLEPLSRQLLASGQESAFNQFDDGRDAGWRRMGDVNDSGVFEQIFYVLVLKARQIGDVEMGDWACELLGIMDARERGVAGRWVEGLGGVEDDMDCS